MVYSIDKEVVLGRRKEEVAAMLQVCPQSASEIGQPRFCRSALVCECECDAAGLLSCVSECERECECECECECPGRSCPSSPPTLTTHKISPQPEPEIVSVHAFPAKKINHAGSSKAPVW